MSSKRVFNFSAGPCCLPVEVLERAAAEMTNWRNTGVGVMEMSHRSPEFGEILAKTTADLRELLEVPDNYHLLFMQGGATLQNTLVALNLLQGNSKADYVHSGLWSKKTTKEARKLVPDLLEIGNNAAIDYSANPPMEEWEKKIRPDAAFVHYCANETVHGLEYTRAPVSPVPIVVDVSSNIMSKKLNIADYGLLYAGAQKNLGPAGVTVVIVKDEILNAEAVEGNVNVTQNYKTLAAADSMLNTPPCYSIYMVGLVAEWVKEKGGVPYFEKMHAERSARLYDYLDNSGYYTPRVTNVPDRSRINVTFKLPSEGELTAKFLAKSKAAGLVNLKGHRSTGGIRASLYNGMPTEGVDALIAFCKKFAAENPQ